MNIKKKRICFTTDGTTIAGQSGSASHGNEEVLHASLEL